MSTNLPAAVTVGTDSYYRQRHADFVRRRPDAAPPSYYLDYGDKCLHQFRQTEPTLSAAGQRWLERTLVDLQRRLEALRQADPEAFAVLETHGADFQDRAFAMHSDAYLASGVADLPVSDLWRIARTPDAGDLLTPDGLREIVEVVDGVGAGRLRELLQTLRFRWNRWRG